LYLQKKKVTTFYIVNSIQLNGHFGAALEQNAKKYYLKEDQQDKPFYFLLRD
jgi:hypothetical protein